jgi:FdhE protein
VANTVWQQRIRRAETLAAQHPFAREILTFYVRVARFQQDLYQRIERAPVRISVSLSSLPDSSELHASFPQFLKLVKQHGPKQIEQIATQLSDHVDGTLTDLLSSVWCAEGRQPSTPEEFLAFAFLQPCAEFMRGQTHLRLESYTLSICPFCNRKPAAGVIRQQGDGGRRSLLCGFCLTEWEFRRIVCTGCGEEDHAKLPVYTAETIPHIRVECCDSCRTYIKSIDLTKNGLANPLVDELASAPLNLWAEEHRYAKLHPNLLGM